MEAAYNYVLDRGGCRVKEIRQFIYPKTKSTECFLRMMETNGYLLWEDVRDLEGEGEVVFLMPFKRLDPYQMMMERLTHVPNSK